MNGPRRAALVAVVILGSAAALDLTREPASQVGVRVLVGAIHLHQRFYAPLLGALGARCRFEPSCSHYAEIVIRRFGAGRGGLLALWRVLRCGPWTTPGTVDPPPVRSPHPVNNRR